MNWKIVKLDNISNISEMGYDNRYKLFRYRKSVQITQMSPYKLYGNSFWYYVFTGPNDQIYGIKFKADNTDTNNDYYGDSIVAGYLEYTKQGVSVYDIFKILIL